ncbi:hypothetical protein JHN63_00955 [Streptomyces sp. MBT65]|uniref:hypothetical protein n=1 Tax=Streptomyces sp. MBT65 TaxID=1488395 RepID=UPI00190E142E|nr:hypothetical protein [Streptomyces sp. MBT65]MBK3572413.1 hypothetical protein [Streptomyces sp. MBT65]
MAYARAVRVGGVAAACGALVLGCTGGGGGSASPPTTSGASRSSTATADSRSAASATPETDPGKEPKTAAQARALIERVISGPELFGTGVTRATPYESDPAQWAVLGDDCLWRLEPLPGDALATLTRHFQVPAAGAKGAVRLSATVTVHRTALDASWEQARMLEEDLDCTEQTQRPGERLTGLQSLSFARGEGGNTSGDDLLLETGQCVSDTHGGPYPYWWQQAVLGSVVAGTSVCGGRGRSQEELNSLVAEVLPRMLLRAQEEIGSTAGGASPSASATKGGS